MCTCTHPYTLACETIEHLATSDRFRFWFLVVGMNAPWAIVPPCLWKESYLAICRCVRACVCALRCLVCVA